MKLNSAICVSEEEDTKIKLKKFIGKGYSFKDGTKKRSNLSVTIGEISLEHNFIKPSLSSFFIMPFTCFVRTSGSRIAAKRASSRHSEVDRVVRFSRS